MMQGLRLVTLDVTGTMFRFLKHPAQQYAETAEKMGIKVNADKLRTSFSLQWVKMNQKYPSFGSQHGVTYQQWWSEFVTSTFLNAGSTNTNDLPKVADELMEFYVTSKCVELTEGTKEILTRLKDQGYELGVVSNYDPRLETLLSLKGVRDKLDFVLTSYSAKCSKPDPRIFHTALQRSKQSNMAPAHALHIGDDFELDYECALAAGWHARLVDHKNLPVLPTTYSSLLEATKSL